MSRIRYFLIILILAPRLILANDFTSKNLAYKYDPDAELRVNFKAYSGFKKVILYVHLAFKSDIYNLDDYTVLHELKNSYSDKLFVEFDTLNLNDYIILEGEFFSIFKLELNNSGDKKLMVLSFLNKHNQNQFFFDINIDPTVKFANPEIILTTPEGIPYFRNYIKYNEPFKILPLEGFHPDNLHFYNYRRSFEVARPPMATDPISIDKTMDIDSNFTRSIKNEITLNQPGLYFVQTDSNSTQGLGFRITDMHYPKLAKLDDLINSLIYFSTRNEWNKLHNAENKKKAFDSYWLKVTKSEIKAKQIIKNYFDRVMLANNYFTGHKDGWKTDRGMIYIMFGKPDEVYKNEDGELWVYRKNDNFPKLKFSFAKVPNLFSDDHYVLVREKQYQNFWFKAVQLWRRGNF